MIALKASILRPGLLVAVSTEVVGNVKYERIELEAEHVNDAGHMVERWETGKEVIDPEEHAAAIKVRDKCRSLIRSVCSKSAFGFLCPKDQEPALDEAILKGYQLANEFNAGAKLSRVSFNVYVGEVAADDERAVKAMNEQARLVLAAMAAGVERMDVKVIRDNAAKAKELGEMMSKAAGLKMDGAIKVAREVASAVAKAVKAGEVAALEVDKDAINKLMEARMVFLDFEEAAPVQAPVLVGRAIELEPEVPAPGEAA
jgi:hypothetical protein